jgi:hypothetical protein
MESGVSSPLLCGGCGTIRGNRNSNGDEGRKVIDFPTNDFWCSCIFWGIFGFVGVIPYWKNRNRGRRRNQVKTPKTKNNISDILITEKSVLTYN